MRLILASTSPRRSEMLARLGLDFEVHPPRPEAELPLPRHLPLARLEQLLPEVSEAKAMDVAQRLVEPSLVVAADTVVYAQGQVLGKPGGGLVAQRYLEKLSGRSHRVLSAVTIISTRTHFPKSAVEVTEVRFRKLSSSDIENYIATGEPLDKAGAYGIQGWGGQLVDWIRGRFDNVVGFPLVTLEELLQGAGMSLHQFRRSPESC